jgi:hypothetical protein
VVFRGLAGPTLRELEGWTATATTTVHGRDAVVFEPPSAGDAEGRLVVDTRGLIHEVHYRVERAEDDGGRLLEITTYELDSKSDVTIREPSWLDEAKNATNESNTTPSTVTTVPG